MSEDFMDFSEELLSTTTQGIDFAQKYLQARKECSHCFNQLQVLIQKAGLETSKKSPQNKIIELMAHKDYGKQAQELNTKMLDLEAEYKGLELVCKAYQAHASAIQSVIKTQLSAEISENMKTKYELFGGAE